MPNVQVAIRCRPKLEHERTIPTSKIEINETDGNVAVLSAAQTKTFRFDKVFSEAANQQDVFDYVAPMVEHALDGLHATIFAYGQTGSGKTFTMEGIDYVPSGGGGGHGKQSLIPKADTPAYQHGIVPRVIQLVFDRARERMGADSAETADTTDDGNSSVSGAIRYRIKCSFVQLYNERVSDLLNPASSRGSKEGLKIRWTRSDQFVVENLYCFECESPGQMREMFLMGIKEKVMGSHHMNIQSSRSHCLFTIHIHSWDASNPDLIRKSELTLVDLAGSEKLALLSQNPSAQLLKESIEINTSLLALGKVITALATDAKQHIPYRDSKLTKLLKHALGGNSMTTMIACINPLDPYVEETMSTLLYAGRARNITNDPRVNEDPKTALIRSLRDEIASLKMELEYYRQLVATGVVDDKLAQQLARRIQSHDGNSGGTAKALTQKYSTSGSDGQQKSGKGGELGATDDSAVSGSSRTAAEVELAEKLMESCRILRSLMGVNAQLREAFDKMKAAKEGVDRRERAVNAENTALRDRIEMLESIAMNADGDNETEDRGESDDGHGVGRRHAEAPQAQHVNSQRAPPNHSNSNVHASAEPSAPSAPTKSRHKPTAVASGRKATVGTTRRSTNNNGRGGSSFTAKLQEYATKYRNPTRGVSYEEYYGRAAPAGGAASGAGSRAVHGRKFDNTHSADVDAKKSKEVAALVEKLHASLPASTLGMVPQSLQDDSRFGSLAFGGADTDVRQMEERRRLRQERLAKLQEQNASLGGVRNPFTTGSLQELLQPSASYQAPPPLGAPSVGGPTSPLKFGRRSVPAQSTTRGGAPDGPPTSTGAGAGGGGGVLNLLSRYGHSDALVHHQQQQQQGSGRAGDSATGRLFAYLSQEESSTAFTADQLDKLRQRTGSGGGGGPGGPAPSGGASGALRQSNRVVGSNNSAPTTPATGTGHHQPSQPVTRSQQQQQQQQQSEAPPVIPQFITRLGVQSTALNMSALQQQQHQQHAPSSSSGQGITTPRSKSSYDMGVYPSHYASPSAASNGSHPSARHGHPQQAPAHEGMRRREHEANEQQRYQQQIYEAQQALLAQQMKHAQARQQHRY